MDESNERPVQVLWVDASGTTPVGQHPVNGLYGQFELHAVQGLDAATAGLQARSWDAVVIAGDTDLLDVIAARTPWDQALRDTAVLLRVPVVVADAARALLAAGAQDVLSFDEADAVTLARRIAFAVTRKQVEREARTAYSTDLNTGLPNRSQLLEHLNQLLALRSRQPSPMAVVAVAVDGLDAVAAVHGDESAQVVRRKVAVRLRGAVRASDVVASLGGNEFALLLARIETPDDAQRVALKLDRALREPFAVMGAPVRVVASVGVAQYPGDGQEAEPLLRTAVAAAALARRTRDPAANDDAGAAVPPEDD